MFILFIKVIVTATFYKSMFCLCECIHTTCMLACRGPRKALGPPGAVDGYGLSSGSWKLKLDHWANTPALQPQFCSYLNTTYSKQKARKQELLYAKCTYQCSIKRKKISPSHFLALNSPSISSPVVFPWQWGTHGVYDTDIPHTAEGQILSYSQVFHQMGPFISQHLWKLLWSRQNWH